VGRQPKDAVAVLVALANLEQHMEKFDVLANKCERLVIQKPPLRRAQKERRCALQQRSELDVVRIEGRVRLQKRHLRTAGTGVYGIDGERDTGGSHFRELAEAPTRY
jgi:hypothetical protein